MTDAYFSAGEPFFPVTDLSQTELHPAKLALKSGHSGCGELGPRSSWLELSLLEFGGRRQLFCGIVSAILVGKGKGRPLDPVQL